jgi:hypothetical protein
VAAAFKVIDQVRDDVRRAHLPGELEVLRRQHVPVKAESEFHAKK